MDPIALWKAASLLKRIGLSIALLIALFGAWKLFWWQHDNGVIAEHEAKVTQAIATASASARAAASEAVADTKLEVENGNERARKAAAGSDDPLKRGLDSLRPDPR